MTGERRRRRWISWILWPVVGLVLVVCASLVLYRPDRPLPRIAPGSSSGPDFVVQIIRPRAGLPLGGLAPPGWFGLEEHLGFDSRSAGAAIRRVHPRRVELAADRWELILVRDADGNVTPETRVVFHLTFEDRPRRVRCRPAVPAAGSFDTSPLPGSRELSGDFHIELAPCEDAETGQSLGWPSKPLILHGSFDRLPLTP